MAEQNLADGHQVTDFLSNVPGVPTPKIWTAILFTLNSLSLCNMKCLCMCLCLCVCTCVYEEVSVSYRILTTARNT